MDKTGKKDVGQKQGVSSGTELDCGYLSYSAAKWIRAAISL